MKKHEFCEDCVSPKLVFVVFVLLCIVGMFEYYLVKKVEVQHKTIRDIVEAKQSKEYY